MGLNFLTTAPQGAFFLFIYKTMAATFRYQIHDRVNKKRNTGVFLEISSLVGKVSSMRVLHNKKGTPCVYCTVRWEDGRSSEHAQHMLVPAP